MNKIFIDYICLYLSSYVYTLSFKEVNMFPSTFGKYKVSDVCSFKIPILSSEKESDEILYCVLNESGKRYHFICIAGTNRDESYTAIKTWIDNISIFLTKRFEFDLTTVLNIPDNEQLIITGHSRGGMIAQIITQQFNDWKLIDDKLVDFDIFTNFNFMNEDDSYKNVFNLKYRYSLIDYVKPRRKNKIRKNIENRIYLVTFASPELISYSNWMSYCGYKDVIFVFGKMRKGSVKLNCSHSIIKYRNEFIKKYIKELKFFEQERIYEKDEL